MADVYNYLSQRLWSNSFWLPEEFDWKDVERKTSIPGFYFPRLMDILPQSVGLGVIVLGIRYLLERYIFYPLGLRLGVKRKKRIGLEKNSLFESTYRKFKHLDLKTEEELAKKTGLDRRHIQRWFRQRRKQDVQGQMQKFCECGWNTAYGSYILIHGLTILWDKSWFWNSLLCYENWPFQSQPSELYRYYLIQLSFYWSHAVSLFTDIKRKDFRIMMCHHILTIALLLFSWVANIVRIGSLIIFIHDAADALLGAAKMAKYSNRQTACEILFACFILVWITTRTGLFPYWIVMNAMFGTPDVHFRYSFNMKTFFVTCLFTLLLLNCMWTYMILKIAFQKLNHGEIKKDARSESEEEESDESENNEKVDIEHKETIKRRSVHQSITTKANSSVILKYLPE